MSRIFCMMGKSSCGKDTLYKMIKEEKSLGLFGIVPYTTRPIRSGEVNGIEYFFTNEQTQKELERAGKVIEARSYHTIHGVWNYFTVNDGQIDLTGHKNYIVIVTLEAYIQIRNYFGKEFVEPVYIETEDGLRLQRALERERLEPVPRYAEMCRRFLSDIEDFSEEKLLDAGIKRRFVNEDLEHTYHEITAFIREFI